jgi:hypothetical protein
MPDLYYSTNGYWTRFIPASDAGDDAWRVMAMQTGGEDAVFPPDHVKPVIRQLRKAGYTVEKIKPEKPGEIDEILAELNAAE